MTQSKYEIVEGISQLPPSSVIVLPYSGTNTSIDLYQKHSVLGVGLYILNTHATNSITLTLDDGTSFVVNAGKDIPIDNIQFNEISASGTGTGSIIIKTLKISLLITKKLVVVH